MRELIVRKPERQTKATPLLFIHGAWHGAWCWDEYFLPYFAQQGYAVYALSLRGHGQSADKERLRWASAKDYVEDVAETVAQRVKTPMLVLGGSRDAIFTIAEVKATARAYDTEARFFPMAHDMMLEAGWKRVAQIMVDWLEKKGFQ